MSTTPPVGTKDSTQSTVSGAPTTHRRPDRRPASDPFSSISSLSSAIADSPAEVKPLSVQNKEKIALLKSLIEQSAEYPMTKSVTDQIDIGKLKKDLKGGDERTQELLKTELDQYINILRTLLGTFQKLYVPQGEGEGKGKGDSKLDDE